MRIQKICLLIGALLCSSLALASTPTKVVGTGKLTHKAEYVELTVNVSSVCYKEIQEAVKKNDDVARAVFNVLTAYKGSDKDKDNVLSSGGYTQPYSEYNDNKTLCAGTFQKQNTVTLKTSLVDGFDKSFAAIQTAVLLLSESVTVGKQRTTVEISSVPQPRLCDETRQKLSLEALTLAMDDAKEKFKAIVSKCKVSKFSISSVEEGLVSRSYDRDLPYAKSAARSIGGSNDVPVVFDDLEITKTLQVTFDSDMPSEDCQPK